MDFIVALLLGIYLLIFGVLWGWFVQEFKIETTRLIEEGYDERSYTWRQAQRDFWKNMWYSLLWPLSLVWVVITRLSNSQ